MQLQSQENIWIGRIRTLTQWLILSGTLNIGLVATFVYFVLREDQQPVILERSIEKAPPLFLDSNEKILRAYSFFSFQELFFLLENKEFVEEGYRKRDLALACLVAFHHFNIERALGGLLLQERKLSFSDEDGSHVITIAIFPGLADYQFQAIIHYAKVEKWPLTSRGLFFALQSQENKRKDPSLIEAFSLTPEFYSVFTLFNRSGISIPKEILINLVIEGDFETLVQCSEKLHQVLDMTEESRRSFLMNYMQKGSKLALHLLFRTDAEFISKRFSDEEILGFLDSLDQKIAGYEPFLKELLISPRSDAVRQKAAVKLYQFFHEEVPESYDHARNLKRFFPEKVFLTEEKKMRLPPEQPPPAAAKKRVHIIQEGDSLWKIARKYNTSIEAIKQLNQLETDRLRVGKQLMIP